MSSSTTPDDKGGREDLRKDFDKLTAEIHSAERTVQVAVGWALNLVHSIFRKSFPSNAAFELLSKGEKIEFIERISRFEDDLLERDLGQAAVGCALFKMWLGALAEGDEELGNYFSRELDHFSRLGDWLQPGPS